MKPISCPNYQYLSLEVIPSLSSELINSNKSQVNSANRGWRTSVTPPHPITNSYLSSAYLLLKHHGFYGFQNLSLDPKFHLHYFAAIYLIDSKAFL
jgi:hypothetical protein